MASSISCRARARTATGACDRRRPATNSASAREGAVAVLAAAWPAVLELSRDVMAASSQSAGRAPSEYRIEYGVIPRAWGSDDLAPGIWGPRSKACYREAWLLHIGEA